MNRLSTEKHILGSRASCIATLSKLFASKGTQSPEKYYEQLNLWNAFPTQEQPLQSNRSSRRTPETPKETTTHPHAKQATHAFLSSLCQQTHIQTNASASEWMQISLRCDSHIPKALEHTGITTGITIICPGWRGGYYIAREGMNTTCLIKATSIFWSSVMSLLHWEQECVIHDIGSWG